MKKVSAFNVATVAIVLMLALMFFMVSAPESATQPVSAAIGVISNLGDVPSLNRPSEFDGKFAPDAVKSTDGKFITYTQSSTAMTRPGYLPSGYYPVVKSIERRFVSNISAIKVSTEDGSIASVTITNGPGINHNATPLFRKEYKGSPVDFVADDISRVSVAAS